MKFLLNSFIATFLVLICSMSLVSLSGAEIYSDLRGSGLVIYDEPADCDAAIEGIGRAENFFKQYGYLFKQSVNVQFKKRVLVALAENLAEGQEVHGLYDPRTGWCEIPSQKELPRKKIFGCLKMTKEFHISTITHEAAHHFYHLILKERKLKVDRSLHEFVAYVVQIQTMQEPEKTKVLDLWRGEVLSGVENINNFVWASNPNRFAVISYRFFLSNPEIMPSILRGEVKTGDADE